MLASTRKHSGCRHAARATDGRPYTCNRSKNTVGASIARPRDITAAARSPGGYGIRPYAVGVDACIDPKTQRLPPRSTGDRWSPLHMQQVKKHRRGEHCSPAGHNGCRKVPGRIWNPPLRRRGRCLHRPENITAAATQHGRPMVAPTHAKANKFLQHLGAVCGQLKGYAAAIQSNSGKISVRALRAV